MLKERCLVLHHNYVVYHLHSDYSLLDSCTQPNDYIKLAKELGMKAIGFSEHGHLKGWFAKMMACKQAGLKYMHGTEIYLTESLTEKVRDNYHTVLYAKNAAGFEELNRLVSRSFDANHFYYTNRISFDEFLHLSDNILTTSACLASPLNKLDVSHPMYEKLVKRYDYLEVQPHDCDDQRTYNIHLAELAAKYQKPLIAGTDTHSLDAYKADCRRILLKAKHKSYGNEDDFDLTWKTYDELVDAFRKQGALPEALYMEAIQNTVAFSEQCEEYEIDTSIRYPILYGTREKDDEMFVSLVWRMFEEKIQRGIIPRSQEQAFHDALEEEIRVFRKLHMQGFMLCMSETIRWCHDNGIPTGPGRGSVGGSRVAYVTDIIDVNPEQWHTVFSRFCNEDREEIGDIDTDVRESDRPRIFEYLIQKFGADKTARVPTYATAAEKAPIDIAGKALRMYWNEEHGFKDDDNPDENPYSITRIKEIKAAFEADPDTAKAQHNDVLLFYDGLVGTKTAQSVHAAGMVVSPVCLPECFGTFIKDNETVLMIDMAEIHDAGLAKLDWLVLSNINILAETCQNAGIPYPKTHEVDFNDPAVWQDMLRSPIGIFQMESDYAFKLLSDFKPKSIFDMSLVTACIRPSGTSYRNDLIARIPHKNPDPIIDELLADNNGYLVYQEDVIKFLQDICGLSGSEADNVRRAIGRKDEARLQKALPQILEGYCSKSKKPRETAETEALEYIQILQDSASYMFNYGHSVAYCIVGYLCAWLRHYHPVEFLTAYLNNAASAEDIANGTALANVYGITITTPRFGFSRDRYYGTPSDKIIAKGLGSVKYMSDTIAEQLYELAHSGQYPTFMSLLQALGTTSVNARQRDILILIDFFSAFGNSRELNQIVNIFEFFKCGDAKKIKSEQIPDFLADHFDQFATNINAKGETLKTWTITDMDGLLAACEEYVRSLHLPDLPVKIKMQNQKEYLGYIDLTTGADEDRRKLWVMDIMPLKDKKTGEPWCYRIDTRSIGSGKISRVSIAAFVFKTLPLKTDDIIYADALHKNRQGYWYLDKYHLVA